MKSSLEMNVMSKGRTNNDKDDDEDRHFDYDDAIEQINPLGLFQLKSIFFLWFSTVAAGCAVVTFAFVAFQPALRCSVNPCEDAITGTYSLNNGSLPSYVLDTFGTEIDAKKAGRKCQRPVLDKDTVPLSVLRGGQVGCQEYLDFIAKTNVSFETCPRNELIIDDSIVRSSLSINYDFICENSFLYNIYNSLYMLGMLAGSFVLGILSDQLGRKTTLMISVTLVSVCGTISAFVPFPWLFGVLRFLTGVGGMGCYMIPYVMTAEMTTPKYIIYLLSVIGLGFVCGEFILALEAYLIRDWFTLQLVSFAPMILVLLLYFLVPESSRWLLAKNRVRESKEIIRRMAQVNGVRQPEFKEVDNAKENQYQRKATVKELFKSRVIALRSVNMMFQWFSVTVGYFGITFASTTLSGDPYLNFFFSTLAEIPVIFLGLIMINLFGRRFNLILMQLLCGICCIAAGIVILFPHLIAFQITLVMIGKFGASFGFAMVYIYTCELFPTNMRLTAVGSCSTIARIGGIFSLLIGALKNVYQPLPLWIMGLIATIAGILAHAFPETTGQDLPMTLEEAIDIGKNSKFKFGRLSNLKMKSSS